MGFYKNLNLKRRIKRPKKWARYRQWRKKTNVAESLHECNEKRDAFLKEKQKNGIVIRLNRCKKVEWKRPEINYEESSYTRKFNKRDW